MTEIIPPDTAPAGALHPEMQALETAAANERTIAAKVDAALAVNDAFLAAASPSPAQQLAQIRMVTRECSALIRLLRHKLDSTAGT